jgi:hypothetical protein
MSPRTDTPPPTDRRMWRRLIALAHPDRAGDEALFVWTRNVYEHVAGDRIEDVRTGAALEEQRRALALRQRSMREHAIEHGHDDAPDAELRAALLRSRRARKGY